MCSLDHRYSTLLGVLRREKPSSRREMATYNLALYLYTLLVIMLVSTTVQSSTLVSCTSSETCSECLQSSSLCAWCASANYTRYRCDTVDSIESYCPPSDIQNPSTKPPDLIKDNPVQDTVPSVGRPIQVSPQEVSLSIRPGQPAYVNITVRPSMDYPVDMYFVMDLSYSMQDDLDTMKRVIVDLATEMQQITTDFQLGFGSFVDKTVSPFIREIYLTTDNPCVYLNKQNDVCEKPYGFRNIFPLSPETDTFQTLLAGVTKSLSSDRTEGGSDSLMQATVCKQEIGWREEARHFIIYMSDADFHIALDGKLGKISTPNDGLCYLDASGYYTKSILMDYPSIGQISSKMKEGNIIPIFAISSSTDYNDIQFYQTLVNQFFESGKVAALASDSSNIVTLVRQNYEQITSEIRMVDTAEDPIKVKYTAYCGTEVKKDSKECLSVVRETAVEFKLEVSVTNQECLPSGGTSFTVKPDGFNEEVLIHVQTLCDCNCLNDPGPSEEQCSGGNGTNVCGVCHCNEGRYGEECECNLEEGTAVENDKCIASEDTQACSGQGTCICGKCLCNEYYHGEYCQCSSTNCPLFNGIKCGGDVHGRCECNDCVCEPDYTGAYCSCGPKSECMVNEKECNGYGTCECGTCKCFPTSPFDGAKCDNCDQYTCLQTQYCEPMSECISCTIYSDGSADDIDCAVKCKEQYVIIVYDNYDNNTSINFNTNLTCEYIDDDNCVVAFIFLINETSTYIILNNERVCTKKTFEPKEYAFLVLGIILGILLAGLAALFIWRMLTFIYDRREYARFEKELNKSTKETGENPLFKSSTTSYRNPMYGK